MPDDMKQYKFPKQLGTCADRLYTLRQARLEQQRVVDEMKAEEHALREHIINNLPKSQATGVAGSVARVMVVPKETPRVVDWDSLYKYVSRTKSFELLQRRLSDAAVKERLDAGKVVPGVEMFQYVDVSINKL